jgi:hypothetical protein
MSPAEDLINAMHDVEVARRLLHWRLARLRVLIAAHGSPPLVRQELAGIDPGDRLKPHRQPSTNRLFAGE